MLISIRQEELQALINTEKQTKEKMLYFKRELENRETNYNTRFSTASLRRVACSNQEDDNVNSTGVLRVIQSPRRKMKWVCQTLARSNRRRIRREEK
jgi:hypothetical protein